jgi:2-polyprenyl-3-methyl-5-hydroxy-6-metoxy-1,4-benzoquinol methylase
MIPKNNIGKRSENSKHRRYPGKETLEVLSWAVNYNKWIASQFLPHIHGKKVLEIGAGVGTISKLLFPYASSYDITDIDPELVRLVKIKCSRKNKGKNFPLDIEKKMTKRQEHHYDVIISVNVLEHIKNDSCALRNMRGLLRKNGKLLMLVPAMKVAFTDLDRKLGHFRRYEKNDLTDIISDAGFSIRHVYYFNCFGLVTWMVRNIFDRDATQLKPFQIWFFEHLVPILSTIEKVVRPPVGISLIVIAERI